MRARCTKIDAPQTREAGGEFMRGKSEPWRKYWSGETEARQQGAEQERAEER